MHIPGVKSPPRLQQPDKADRAHRSSQKRVRPTNATTLNFDDLLQAARKFKQHRTLSLPTGTPATAKVAPPPPTLATALSTPHKLSRTAITAGLKREAPPGVEQRSSKKPDNASKKSDNCIVSTGQKRPAPPGIRQKPTKKPAKGIVKNRALIDYNLKYRGLKSEKAEPMNGKSMALYSLSGAYVSLHKVATRPSWQQPSWKLDLPSRSQLHNRHRFGCPSRAHSFTVEASFDSCMFTILLSGYLGKNEFTKLCNITPLIAHLARMIVRYHDYDFTWIAHEDPDWKKQSTVPQSHARAMLAAMFHFQMHAPDVMRFLGGTYTGEYRDIDATVQILTSYDIDPWLIAQYVRATTVGCLNHFVAHTTRANANLHWREGNHTSINKYLVTVVNTMTKEHRNRFNMPLPGYMYRYMPHCFITPQHALAKPGKAMRLIFDATKRYNALSTPVNMMTSTHLGTEMDCLYGDTFVSLLERIWDLRITYPNTEIVTHANDVKSCFKQMKLHPDVMPAFSILIAEFLYLQSALPFGTDFLPQNWEPVRRLIEVLATKLFDDKSLRQKHRQYLDRLQWEPTLGMHTQFVPAKACTQRRGVLDEAGNPVATPQRLFVDDSVYADIYEATRVRIEQTVAAGIEAIFILLGQSDVSKRQDPISFDKMEEMLVSYLNKILGILVDTRRLEVGVPPDYVRKTITLLKAFHPMRKCFTVNEMERLTGMLVFIANTAPWLRFMLAHVYVSVTAAIKANTTRLITTDKHFRQMLRDARPGSGPTRASTFAQSEAAR